MLRLAVPDDQILCTSYHAWNDFLNPESQLAAMGFRGVLLSKYDCLQATIPQIKARWVCRARPMPIPRATPRQILRNPDWRHLLIPLCASTRWHTWTHKMAFPQIRDNVWSGAGSDRRPSAFQGQPCQALCGPAKTDVIDKRNRARRKVQGRP
jgi:hypothetical protein